MIVLDTNVVSEMMQATPDRRVLAWLDRQPSGSLCLSAISEAELWAGALFLPAGRRRERLLVRIELMIADDFPGRILPFDSAAARAYAVIAAERRAAGRPISQPDAQIAAIARAAGAPVATRNSGDFQDCGIAVIDPWDASAS